jgi:hypothetical protein
MRQTDNPRLDYPVQIFMKACVASYAKASHVSEQATAMGFSPLSQSDASIYLKGRNGMAWHSRSEKGDFGLGLTQEGLCSVFIHQGEPNRLTESIEAWLPPDGSGFTYSKEQMPSPPELTTTSYKIFRGARLEDLWVLTISNQANSELRAIMSYARQ